MAASHRLADHHWSAVTKYFLLLSWGKYGTEGVLCVRTHEQVSDPQCRAANQHSMHVVLRQEPAQVSSKFLGCTGDVEASVMSVNNKSRCSTHSCTCANSFMKAQGAGLVVPVVACHHWNLRSFIQTSQAVGVYTVCGVANSEGDVPSLLQQFAERQSVYAQNVSTPVQMVSVPTQSVSTLVQLISVPTTRPLPCSCYPCPR